MNFDLVSIINEYFPIEFSKLTLATSKIVAMESANEQKYRMTTTTTTTMTKVLDEAPAQVDDDDISCGQQQQQQQQKILLYESTRDETQSALLTDDDTDSVGSSLDSKELESGLKEVSQPTQNTVANTDQIDSQMQSLSFISTLDRHRAVDAKSDNVMHNMSRQFDQLDISHNQDNEQAEQKAIEKRESILTLSSTDTLDCEPNQLENTEEKNDSNSVIVLSDSDTEEAKFASESPPLKRNISQEPPLKPTMASSNDPAMYNISTIDKSSMEQVNNFFDNVPFIETGENSFNSSHISKSLKDDFYVPETTDEESAAENSINVASFHGETDQKEKEKIESKQQQLDAEVAHDSDPPDFSDNNIIVDIPVIKSSSDQPCQLIRSQSGVRLTASRSSPITKITSGKIDSDGIKRSSSNVVLKTPGNCGITVNSSNGQLNIAAKININIKIVEDSSEESSEDNKPVRKSQAIQSNEDCPSSLKTNINSNDINRAIPPTQLDGPCDSKNNRTPKKNSELDAVNTTPRTPKTASKLKQFEFVPPKSMTKSKNMDSKQQEENGNDAKPLNKSMTSERSDGFQVDKNIPISPRDQKLLVLVDFLSVFLLQ